MPPQHAPPARLRRFQGPTGLRSTRPRAAATPLRARRTAATCAGQPFDRNFILVGLCQRGRARCPQRPQVDMLATNENCCSIRAKKACVRTHSRVHEASQQPVPAHSWHKAQFVARAPRQRHTASNSISPGSAHAAAPMPLCFCMFVMAPLLAPCPASVDAGATPKRPHHVFCRALGAGFAAACLKL